MTSMRPWDFLKRGAETPLRGRYLAAGAVFEISTNSEPILAVAEECFAESTDVSSAVDCRLRLWVDPAASAGPPWPKPYFRGLDHLVFAGFDPQNSLLVNLRRRCVIGRFSPAMSADRAYWKTVIFPVLLTMVGASVGITELHCGCVARAGDGLLLAGDSGSGKSTLSLALTLDGFAYVADDRTYVSGNKGELRAWGLPTPLKLRSEAAAHFPELSGLEPSVTLNGERAFQIDPQDQLHRQCTPCCRPRWLISLERRATPEFSLSAMSPVEAAARLKRDLLPESPEATKFQWAIIDELVKQSCHLLRYGGDPRDVARALAQRCEADQEATSVAARPK
jgi:hypothetical protein